MNTNSPGGAISTRPLHFIWLLDCSGSMSSDGKIQALNNAIREAIPHMRVVADENPNAEILIRVLKFSSGAQWHVPQPTPVSSFQWTDIEAGGVTDMGKAFKMVAEQLRMPPMSERALPPVLVLVSDGQPTDDYMAGFNELMSEPWGRKAVRISIAIGRDTDYEILQKFIGNSEMTVLEADNPEMLVRRIRWVSTAVLQSVSSPNSQQIGTTQTVVNVPIPTTENTPTLTTGNIVW
jgi:uncharacterized protein YegL